VRLSAAHHLGFEGGPLFSRKWRRLFGVAPTENGVAARDDFPASGCAFAADEAE
jgi:AraC-like DNA-binding protein